MPLFSKFFISSYVRLRSPSWFLSQLLKRRRQSDSLISGLPLFSKFFISSYVRLRSPSLSSFANLPRSCCFLSAVILGGMGARRATTERAASEGGRARLSAGGAWEEA